MSQSEPLQHECPMCGEKMRLKRHTRVAHVPGTSEGKPVEILEWECPECDYFEEFDEEAASGR